MLEAGAAVLHGGLTAGRAVADRAGLPDSNRKPDLENIDVLDLATRKKLRGPLASGGHPRVRGLRWAC
jgi:hypothetical protein